MLKDRRCPSPMLLVMGVIVSGILAIWNHREIQRDWVFDYDPAIHDKAWVDHPDDLMPIEYRIESERAAQGGMDVHSHVSHRQ